MSSPTPKVTPTSGVFALVCMLSLLVTGYAYYLVATMQHLDYQAEALAPVWYMIKPYPVVVLIAKGGYLGTLVAVLLHVAHAALFAITTFCLVSASFAHLAKPRLQETGKLNPQSPLENGECESLIPGSEVMVMIAGAKDSRTGHAREGIVDKTPYRQVFFRCTRALVKLTRQPKTPIERLQVALHSMLLAHPDVPASVGAHHGDTSLLKHSEAISKAVAAYMKEHNWDEPLARVVGLAHDMDKLLAYTKKGDTWVKTKDCTHHNTYSAYIVANQPEFHDLDEDDQKTLTISLRYYHHPQMLPKDCSSRVERLVQALRHVDGFVTRDEKREGIAKAQAGERTPAILEEAMTTTINDLNINDYRTEGRASGWTRDALDCVIVPMSTILESIGAHLPADLSRQLQLGVETRSFHHPAIGMMLETLDQMGLLLHKHKEIESEIGLFDVKSGVKDFSACVLLSKARLEELLPATVIKWGMARYALRIRRATQDKTADEE